VLVHSPPPSTHPTPSPSPFTHQCTRAAPVGWVCWFTQSNTHPPHSPTPHSPTPSLTHPLTLQSTRAAPVGWVGVGSLSHTPTHPPLTPPPPTHSPPSLTSVLVLGGCVLVHSVKFIASITSTASSRNNTNHNIMNDRNE